MSDKRPLPLAPTTRRPTSDAMRQALGGRLDDERMPGAGRLVLVALDGRWLEGAVVVEQAGQAFVWLTATEVRRVPTADLRTYEGALGPELEARARDLVAFAALRENSRVRFETPRGGAEEGVLVEKCRFGALVARDDGAIVAVGFRSVSAAG